MPLPYPCLSVCIRVHPWMLLSLNLKFQISNLKSPVAPCSRTRRVERGAFAFASAPPFVFTLAFDFDFYQCSSVFIRGSNAFAFAFAFPEFQISNFKFEIASCSDRHATASSRPGAPSLGFRGGAKDSIPSSVSLPLRADEICSRRARVPHRRSIFFLYLLYLIPSLPLRPRRHTKVELSTSLPINRVQVERVPYPLTELFGNFVPNIGALLFDCSRVASS